MSKMATYFIVQLVPDLFRREAVNVGVFVEKAGKVAARFVGEREDDGELDRRKIRHLIYPDAYSEWVTYWRRVAKKTGSIMDEVVRNTNGNFMVIPAGEVSDTADDSPESIANYLYPLLVSEGGLIEALGMRDDSTDLANAKLKSLVNDAFEEAQILGDDAPLWVAHPVRTGVLVQGDSAPHQPAYTQENGPLSVMELVDFTSPKRATVKDHAGWAAFMFADVRKRHGVPGLPPVEPVAIVRLRPIDEDDSTVRYGLNMLEKTSRIVNWHDANQQKAFIRERVETAQRTSV